MMVIDTAMSKEAPMKIVKETGINIPKNDAMIKGKYFIFAIPDIYAIKSVSVLGMKREMKTVCHPIFSVYFFNLSCSSPLINLT